ncbi:MAG: hypothetical protein QOJ35_2621 [Solirubrobacteraceae bacterium]|nr:hypothetical protein [Solirubrobacteraceae bacterium]
MRNKVVGAVVGVALLVVAGVVIFLVADGGGNDRKASIGAQGPKPDNPKAGPKSNDEAPDHSAGGKSADAPGKVKAVAAMQRKIERMAQRQGNHSTYASYLDTTTGEIMLVTDAPPSEVADIKNLPDAADKQEAEKAKVVQATTKDVWSRVDDIPPFYGGGGIAAGGAICSSGYAAKKANGAIVAVTAGHCWADGTAVTTESGANAYGTVSDRRLPTVTGGAIDAELVGGRSYAGRIFTGGVTSTTSIPVVAAGAATAGYTNYCHSGRTTGQSCGHTASSINGQVCTSTGCKSPVIVWSGGNIIQPGDSGGTFYSTDGTSAWIRGNTIASGGGTAYTEPWTSIAPALGLTIVTG